MLTKTRKVQEEKNDHSNDHSFSIPENIKKDINEKGFHLYEWIGNDDVKQSIQRDFLKTIGSTWGQVLSTIFIIISFLLINVNIILFTSFFLLGMTLITAFFIIYLSIITISRTNILRKNSYVLVTDSSVSINGKINKLKDGKIQSSNETKLVSHIFEEPLFGRSNLGQTKSGLFKEVTKNLGKGFSWIFKLGNSRSKNGAKAMLVLLVIYSIYAFSLGLIYLIGIFIIWIFGILISIINKQILLKTGHEITTINNRFENIDKKSKTLIKEKDILSSLLNDAINNDWKDSLLSKINSGIENINKNASHAIDTSIILKKEIEISKYKEMFNFNIYNSWIKKQIYIPLEQILNLLHKNLEKLNENKINIEKQILEITDQSLQGPLVASKTRTEMRIVDIQKHMKGIEVYINKLK